MAASPVTEPDLAVTRNVASPRAVTVPSGAIEPAWVWFMAHVTAAFGIGFPALSRTTARIFSVRPTRTWESSARTGTTSGVWARAAIAGRRRASDLYKDFLHRPEAAIACAVDVVEAPARRSVIDRLRPIDSQCGLNGRRDVV